MFAAFTGHTYLWTDASEKGFGTFLEQEGSDGHRYPIAYASRQTNPTEAKYAFTELEVRSYTGVCCGAF